MHRIYTPGDPTVSAFDQPLADPLTMPVASIDGDGTSLYYEDTGAPPGGRSDYTTFVLLHGLAFNLSECIIICYAVVH